MDIEQTRALSDVELETALSQARQDLWQARFALSTRQLKDFSTISQTRRTMARILTVQQGSAAPSRAREGSGRRAMTGGAAGAVESGRRRSAAWSATRWTRRSLSPSSASGSVIRSSTSGSFGSRPSSRRTTSSTRPRSAITVLIEESRPLSATKRWRLVEIVARAGDQGPVGNREFSGDEAETRAAIHSSAHPGRKATDGA